MTEHISEYKQVQDRFQTVFDLAPVGIAIITPQGRFIETNKACQDILCYTKDELHDLSYTELIPPNESGEELNLCKKIIARDETKLTLEKRYVRKDGTIIWVNLSVTFVSGEEGLPEYTIAYIQDISDAYNQLCLRREAELKLQQNREKLEQRVKGRTTELAQTNMQLQQEITERKLLMEALKENEQCLKAVLDAIPGAVSWITAEGKYIGVNQHLAQTLNLSSQDFTGKHLGFLNNSPQFVKFMIDFLHSDTKTNQDIVEIIVNELNRYYLLNAQKYQEGTQAVSVGIDITENQESKLEIQRQKEFLQNILDTNFSMIYVKDREGRYVLANQAFANRRGLSISDLIGKTTAELHSNSADVDRFIAEDMEVFETLQPKFIPDEVSYTPTGEVRWYQTIKQPLISSDGKVIQVLGVSTDITDRKLAEEQLRHSEEQLRRALEAAHMGTWDWNLETGEGTSSHNLELLYGLAPNTFDGTYEAFLAILHPDDRDFVHQNTQSALEKGGDGNLEFRIIRPDGTIRWIESKYQVFTNSRGEPLRMSGINLDITHRKEAEIKIKASLREKDILLQEIHHRVKNNLQVISSLLDLQSHHIYDPVVLELFQESQNRVKSMALVHEKLYQSRDFARINFADYIENLTNYLFQVYAVHSHLIAIQLDIENVHLTIDTAIPCGLILSELVSNGIKYAFPHGRAGTIKIALHSQPDNRYTLIVQDNGIGIPDDLDLKHTKSLGLQLVTILTEQLDGILEINSNRGTEFKICFPQPNQ
ncbi:PAS domain S-box protein [Limnofasciculus baicalensis]|uniref:PAS domain S-box protein n=1 Tax=Limnofasciculus baicalensis BBK-W-15 TaxID=2699891 RepID=A0AAE3GP72_9CYAN|nr:PAS domain S-box protein [Limnofasciculus baicalensis]MCP2727278.1 PAS domain S-box protein [Limnofasciculus baicalensis BBK-W-15]